MQVIPAIDLKEGHCVRLKQGRMQEATIFSEEPVKMAAQWIEQGTERLHLVDLDGAFAGKPQNYKVIEEIAKTFPEVTLQVGGGIREEDTIQRYLDIGVRYVILGTKAVREPHMVNDFCLSFPGHIIVGLDAKNGKVAVDGWSKLSHHDVLDMAEHFERDGVEAIIYTDISRDGMMGGVNVESTVKLANAVRIPVIASGGVTNIDDIKALKAVEDENISGVVVGRAIYEGTLDLAEAQKLAHQ